MIIVDPTPCGRYVFASSLVFIDGRAILLTAQRTIQHSPGRRLGDVLAELATEAICEITSKAAQCGLNQQQISAMLDAAPEVPIERRSRLARWVRKV